MIQLQLRTTVTAEFLAQAELELIPVFHACLMRYRSRFRHPRISRLLFRLVKVLSILGLAVALIPVFVGDKSIYFDRIYIACVLFFLAMLIFFWNMDKRVRQFSNPYPRYWMWLAKFRAGTMLKVAKKSAPFLAEYDCRGDLAVYCRTGDKLSNFAWSRRLKGLYVCRNSFTLLFKKEKSIYPNMIVLHDGSETFETYLKELGLRKFDAPATSASQVID